jgi:hypothetical protein
MSAAVTVVEVLSDCSNDENWFLLNISDFLAQALETQCFNVVLIEADASIFFGVVVPGD